MVGLMLLVLFASSIAMAALGHPGIYRAVFGGRRRSADWAEPYDLAE